MLTFLPSISLISQRGASHPMASAPRTSGPGDHIRRGHHYRLGWDEPAGIAGRRPRCRALQRDNDLV